MVKGISLFRDFFRDFNDSYYQALLQGRDVVDGFSVLRHSWLIPFKAKAWLDLNERIKHGQHVDSRDDLCREAILLKKPFKK